MPFSFFRLLLMLYIEYNNCTLFIDNCQVKEYILYLFCKKLQGGSILITYEPLYETMKKKNISTYKLLNEFGISRSLLLTG